MQEKFLTEKIKFLTERFKLLFAMLILLGGGLAALFARRTFLKDNFDFYLLTGGILFALSLLLLIVIIGRNINNYINKLKKK